MSEDRTKETNDTRTFEERVFARFDAIDNRFDAIDERFNAVDGRFDRVEGRLSTVEIKVTKLEARQHDTKPIWERALAEIVEIKDALRQQHSESQTGIESLRTDLRSEFQTGIESLRTDLRSEFQTGIESLRAEVKAEFATLRHEMEHGYRRVARTIDTLNQNFLEMQTYQRYVDRRLDELETEIKPT